MAVAALENLLMKEGAKILPDNSAIYVMDELPPGTNIFTSPTFGGIDIRELECFGDSLETCARVLRSEKIVTIPEAVSEWLKFERFVRNRLERMEGARNASEYYADRRHHVPYARKSVRLAEHDEDFRAARRGRHPEREKPVQYALFRDAVKNAKAVSTALHSHLITVENPRLYTGISDMVKELCAARGLKRAHANGHTDLHTDESLVAAALYLAQQEESKVIVATRDNDIIRLMEWAFCTIYSVESFGGEVPAQLCGSPVRVCFLPDYERTGATIPYAPGHKRMVYSDVQRDAAYYTRALKVS